MLEATSPSPLIEIDLDSEPNNLGLWPTNEEFDREPEPLLGNFTRYTWLRGNVFGGLPEGMSRLTTAAMWRRQKLIQSANQRKALSPREVEVVERTIIESSAYDIVAEQLKITPNTVRTHNARAKHKYGVPTVDEFTLNATLTGEIDGRKILGELGQRKNLVFLPSLHSRAQDLLIRIGESTSYLNDGLMAENLSLSISTIKEYWDRHIQKPYGLQTKIQALVFLGEIMKLLTDNSVVPRFRRVDPFEPEESKSSESRLSPQESQVAAHYILGLGPTEIARKMDISTNSVRTYYRRITNKLRADSIAEAMQIFQWRIGRLPLT